MAQRKNSVQLSDTAHNYLQGLVMRGEYASVDDAASYLITSLRSSVVEQHTSGATAKPPEPETQKPSKPNLAEQFKSI